MNRIITTNNQLKEYIKKKRNDKYFYQILESLYLSKTNLTNTKQQKYYNQSIINDFKNKGLMTKTLHESLINLNIITDDLKII